MQGKWPTPVTTPESHTDRNAVSSASFMHMATASHPVHDSPRRDSPPPPVANGKRVCARSPGNALSILRRSGDTGRREERRQMDPHPNPSLGQKPATVSGGSGGSMHAGRTGRTASTPPVPLSHVSTIAQVASQRSPSRLRSRSSDSTTSPRHTAANMAIGVITDDTSVTDHVTPEVSGVSMHGEAMSSAGDGVSSLSGPDNSLLQSVESAGGGGAAASTAAVAGRGDEALLAGADITHGSDSRCVQHSASMAGSTSNPRGRRTYHINHTASDATPLASPSGLQHLKGASSSCASPRPRSLGPASIRSQKDVSALPRLRESALRAGGGPDSARGASVSVSVTESIGGSESITGDGRRYYGYGGQYHLHDVTERGFSPGSAVSPGTASGSTTRLRAGTAAAAATASLTRNRRSSSIRQTPHQMIPGPPDSAQSHDGQAASVLMHMEAPSSSSGMPESGRMIGRQRSGGSLYATAYPKTGASSGGIQACTMDALAAGVSGGGHAVRAL